MKVGIQELGDRLSHYVTAVNAGGEMAITDHGEVVARLVPPEDGRRLQRLIAEGLVTPASAVKAPRSRSGIDCAGIVSDLVAEQRR